MLVPAMSLFSGRVVYSCEYLRHISQSEVKVRNMSLQFTGQLDLECSNSNVDIAEELDAFPTTNDLDVAAAPEPILDTDEEFSRADTCDQTEFEQADRRLAFLRDEHENIVRFFNVIQFPVNLGTELRICIRLLPRTIPVIAPWVVNDPWKEF